jgi:hypothetical protein
MLALVTKLDGAPRESSVATGRKKKATRIATGAIW